MGDNSRSAKWSAIAAIASAIAAIVIFLYMKELNKPILSLEKTNITMELKWNFLDLAFEFKNIGNEPLKITKLLMGRYDSKTKQFDYIEKSPPLKLIFPKQKFVYRKTMDIDKEIAKKILAFMEKNFSEGKVYDLHPKTSKIKQLFGKSIFMLSIEYRSTSVFSLRKTSLKDYFVYDGVKKYELSINDYKKIEDIIPDEFKIN